MPPILRSMLYVPANSWRMINNAADEGPDAVILDLEDGCPMADKETARIFARDSIPMLKEQGLSVFVRLNSVETGLTETDLEYVVTHGLDGVVLAKTESSQDVSSVARTMTTLERTNSMSEGDVKLVPLMETPLGVLNLKEILATNERIIAVGFGAGDYSREMGAGMGVTGLSPDEYFPMVLTARSLIAMNARAAGVVAIDSPYFGLVIDLEGLSRETRQVKLLGFSGKQLTHPRHVKPVNQVFTPSDDEVELAAKVVEAYEDARAKGLGATSLGGKMIDFGSAKRARSVLELFKAVAAKEA